ncbi:hypothetical protein BJ878DRAFT_543502 [Calycina marina]|uniref:Casein kinase II beta 2 subunit n=1 Tax=Calycina marina TaxID=1763456 RepID=A0A9P7Z0T2_9HELO|nr:hypothetical protein BJ878DRAFT_543502 [Calycina marina]
MAPSAGLVAPVAMRLFRHALNKTSSLMKARLEKISIPKTVELGPVRVHLVPRHPLHPAAALRQSRGLWYTTHSTINATVRRYFSGGSASKFNRADFPTSATARAVASFTGRAPFASILRPNLTGGTLPRAAGGYGLGGGRVGGARYFSHTPAAPAQVVNNVSAAVRAFCLSGQKAQFNGLNDRGEKGYRNFSKLQEETTRKIRSVSIHSPGSFIDFHVNPTVTALSPLGAAFPFGSVLEQSPPNLNTEGFLDMLSVDFSRALKDLAGTMNDLKRLASFGDLPITLENKSTLRVRFPGCDAETVERLCDEVGVQRGIIDQDTDSDASVGPQVALIFPYVPTLEPILFSPSGSLLSQSSHDYDQVENFAENLWADGSESMSDASEHESDLFTRPRQLQNPSSAEYERLEGIYRFIEQCDNSKRL